MRLKIKSKLFIITAAALVLLIFLHSTKIFNPAEKALFLISSPAQKYLYGAGIKITDFFDRFKAEAGAGEIELLKTQLRSLMLRNAQLKLIAEENKILKKELNFTNEHKYEYVSARVIGADSLQNSSFLLLEIEDENYSEEDIENDMPIIAEDGILVGKVAVIKQNRIFMMPITAMQSAVAATVLNKAYTIGVAEGELNLSVKMRMIPQSETIKQGDLVVTSGMEVKMPKGLLLGTVSKVSQDPQAPFNIAYISPLYNIKKISDVLIIKKF